MAKDRGTGRAQIAYDQHSDPLTSEIEDLIKSSINLILEEPDFSGKFLSILFCAPETIRKLNAEYRGIDKFTDILSWLYDEETIFEGSDDFAPFGELAVCLEKSREQAQNFGWSHEVEILRLLTHGLAHLAGYNHELSEIEEARALQFEIKLLSLIGLDKIYS